MQIPCLSLLVECERLHRWHSTTQRPRFIHPQLFSREPTNSLALVTPCFSRDTRTSLSSVTHGTTVRLTFRSHRNLPPQLGMDMALEHTHQSDVRGPSSTPRIPSCMPDTPRFLHLARRYTLPGTKTHPYELARQGPLHVPDAPTPCRVWAHEQPHLGGCRYTLIHTVHDASWHARLPRTQQTPSQTRKEDGRDVRTRLPPKPDEKEVRVRAQLCDGSVQSWNGCEKGHRLTWNTSTGRLLLQQLECQEGGNEDGEAMERYER